MKIAATRKVFCSYAFTGQNPQEVEARMAAIVRVLQEAGITVYCNLYDERTQGFINPEDYLDLALDELTEYDYLLAIKVPGISVGQVAEITVARRRSIPIIFAERDDSVGDSYLARMAQETFMWSNEADLLAKVRELV